MRVVSFGGPGNTWLDSSDASFGDLRKNFSVFFGVDSPLRPVYLATRPDAEEHEKAFYPVPRPGLF